MRLVFNAIIAGALVFAGWVVGTFYPAPPAITGPIVLRGPLLAQRLGVSDLSMRHLRSVLRAEQFTRLSREASAIAAAAGDAIIVERDDGMFAEVASAEIAQEHVASSAPTTTTFESALSLCPRMTVSNAPPADANGAVRNYSSIIDVSGVRLAVNPTTGACLSSAVGPRGGGTHRGLDFYSGDGGPIFAAADGVVIERKYRDDYGNMLLIDHGQGVYTRYAHLSSFADEAAVGAQVHAGQQIGLMGNTASYRIPVHLHYELLLGDYNNPRQSFGLTARSPFEFSPPV